MGANLASSCDSRDVLLAWAKQACSNSTAATIGHKDINGLLKKPAYLNLPGIGKGSPNSTTLSQYNCQGIDQAQTPRRLAARFNAYS
jgi:hypothetical protein